MKNTKKNSEPLSINNINTLKTRSCTFDTKKKAVQISENQPININIINNINFINPSNSSGCSVKGVASPFNRLPKIVPRHSNMLPLNLPQKYSIFNKTSGIFGIHKGITFNSGLIKENNNENKINNNNNEANNNNHPSNPISNLTSENTSNTNGKMAPDASKMKKLKIVNKPGNFGQTFMANPLQSVNVGQKKIVFNNANKKLDYFEENNDSFIDELTDLLSNVTQNGNPKVIEKKKNVEDIKENDKENNKEEPDLIKENLDKCDNDDKEPDPRINFEHISRVNNSRPQTSYGGLNARRKNLQRALQSSKYRPNGIKFQQGKIF